MTTCFFDAVVDVEQVVSLKIGTGKLHGGGVRGDVTTLKSPRSESSPRPESYETKQNNFG